MSSSSTSKNIFPLNLTQLFDQQNAMPTSNISRQSPLSSSTTTRLLTTRPFYRSQVTPDPFDYSNNYRREQTISNPIHRRYSSVSSSSPAYFSDHEPSSPTISMHRQYRSTNNNNPNNNRALISVSGKQSPLITIASGASPTRSQIRVSSLPKTKQSTVREIRISRADSPSISINRANPNPNSSNGSTGAFHISVGAPTQITSRRQTSPSFQHQMDNRMISNVVANRFKPLITYTTPDRSNLPPAPNSASVVMRHGNLINQESADVDQLRRLLMKSIHSSNETNFFGMCARCHDGIIGEENGLVAMDRMYHMSCFTCTMCGCRLRGMHFYAMENQPYCESCYINSLEKCIACSQPITDRILRATGKPYHARCFSCVACEKNLDGISFTFDANMQIHCLECFHQKFAPRCYACHQMILPNEGEEETVRIVALDRNYHPHCYRCENCQTPFTNEEGSYPIDGHVLCLQCNRTYTRAILDDH